MRATLKTILLALILIIFTQLVAGQNIFDAVEKGDIEQIKTLIADDPECTNQREEKSGSTPLHKAAFKGQMNICKVLIDKGADIRATDNWGDTPLIWAIFGKSTSIMDDLIKHGADINQKMVLGWNALHFAASYGDVKVIEYLLSKGIKVDVKTDYGDTPLLCAVLAGKRANAKNLIDNGATLDVINNDGYTLISLAVSKNDTNMVNLLLENGIDIQKQNSFGDIPLHAAAYQGYKEMITLLLEKGVDINIANDQGVTALDLAINRNHQEIQQLLISVGAKQGKGRKNSDKFDKIGILSSGIENIVKVTIIYDNYVYKDGMEADWGFSCYIEGPNKDILFDTGTKSDLLIHNLKELDVDHNKVDIVVLSHEHGDHIGGLFPFLAMNHNVSVIMPYSFSYNFVSRVESFGAKVLAVKEPFEICKDVYLSGELDAKSIKEQSLAINTKKGLVIIAGCSHPGIVNIVRTFKETLNKNIYMVIGGFHLMNKTKAEVTEIIDQMKELGVQKCGATHCTGEKQIQMFKEGFGEDYIQMGVGRAITF